MVVDVLGVAGGGKEVNISLSAKDSSFGEIHILLGIAELYVRVQVL